MHGIRQGTGFVWGRQNTGSSVLHDFGWRTPICRNNDGTACHCLQNDQTKRLWAGTAMYQHVGSGDYRGNVALKSQPAYLRRG